MLNSLRSQISVWRDRFSPSRRRLRRAIERDEQARVEGFLALTAVVGRGDVRELVLKSSEAELVLTDGRRFRYDPQDRLERLYSVPVTGEFERKETEWVRRWVSPNEYCVDAGGSFGWYAVLLSHLVGREGEVHVFEPIPRTAQVLEANLLRNACANTQVHAVALAEVEGTLDLFVPDIGVSGSLRLHDNRGDFETFPCPVHTLDGLAESEEWPRLDFIKADIEGAELALLKGAERSIRRWQPRLLLEVQKESTRLFGHEPVDVFNWLAELGYIGGYVLPNGRLAQVSGHEPELPDYNFVFVPSEDSAKYEWEPPT